MRFVSLKTIIDDIQKLIKDIDLDAYINIPVHGTTGILISMKDDYEIKTIINKYSNKKIFSHFVPYKIGNEVTFIIYNNIYGRG